MKLAILFAGQGAQAPGMGKSLFDASPAARQVFQQADALRNETSHQCFAGDAALLEDTLNTQPCLFAVDLAAAMALAEKGIVGQAAVGFSLGEIPALCYCGLLSFDAAFQLVMHRAQLMKSAAENNPGGMAAILKMEAETLEQICAECGEVWPVNYNCPGQIVIAGKKPALDAACTKIAAAGGRAMPLAVSGAFHTPLMGEASQGLASYLVNVQMNDAKIPLYANVTANEYEPPYDKLISAQVQSPVRFEQTIRNLVDQGFDTFVEVGPGKRLVGMVKRIAPDCATYVVEDEASLSATVSALTAQV